MFLPRSLVKLSIVESLHDREVACSASDLQDLNLKSCVWRAVSSHYILRRFFWPSLACMCTKVAKRPIHFILSFSEEHVTLFHQREKYIAQHSAYSVDLYIILEQHSPFNKTLRYIDNIFNNQRNVTPQKIDLHCVYMCCALHIYLRGNNAVAKENAFRCFLLIYTT